MFVILFSFPRFPFSVRIGCSQIIYIYIYILEAYAIPSTPLWSGRVSCVAEWSAEHALRNKRAGLRVQSDDMECWLERSAFCSCFTRILCAQFSAVAQVHIVSNVRLEPELFQVRGVLRQPWELLLACDWSSRLVCKLRRQQFYGRPQIFGALTYLVLVCFR